METFAYLNDLPLTQAQKEKITAHPYENAATLYLMCRAMPVLMKERLEMVRLDELIKALEAKLTPEERSGVQAKLDAMGS